MSKLELDKELIRELATLLDETGLTEIEIGDDDNRIRVARQGTLVSAAAPAPTVVAAASEGPAAASPEPTADNFADHPGAVSSPMVGTVYRAPEPDAAYFVNVGDNVQPGQTLLMIEAMKTYNEIRASRGGTVTRVFVENATPVEYGDILLLIE